MGQLLSAEQIILGTLAFVGGRLWLLQIRPFNESREARGAGYLIQMDKALRANLNRTVRMTETMR